MPVQTLYAARDQHDLVLVGFVTFLDPPMEGVAETLSALRRDGVVMECLTGDNELVAPARFKLNEIVARSVRIFGRALTPYPFRGEAR